nr:MAG TPA: hypothetical protein [Caudoviricetes sp.]
MSSYSQLEDSTLNGKFKGLDCISYNLFFIILSSLIIIRFS